MAGLWTQEQADQLLQRGLINQDQYDRNLAMGGSAPPPAAAAPTLTPEIPAPTTWGSNPSTPIEPTREQVAAGNAIPAPPNVINLPEQVIEDDPIPMALPEQTVVGKPNYAALDPRTKDPRFQRAVEQRQAAEAGVRAAEDKVVEAQQRELDLKVQQATEEADRQAQADEAYERRLQEHEADRAKRKAEVDRLGSSLLREADDIASTKIDQNRIFANQTTGDQVLGYFMALAGGMNTQGRNFYLEAVQKNVDRDIEVQKAQLTNRQNALTQKRGVYGDMLNLLKDDDAAFEASRLAMLKGLELKMKVIAAKYGPDRLTAEFQTGLAQLGAAREEADLKTRDAIAAALAKQDAAGGGDVKEVRKTYQEMYKLGIEKGMSPEQAHTGALAATVQMYGPQAAAQGLKGGSNVPWQDVPGAPKQVSEEEQKNTDFVRQADGMIDAIANKIDKSSGAKDTIKKGSALGGPMVHKAVEAAIGPTGRDEAKAMITNLLVTQGLTSESDKADVVGPLLPKPSESGKEWKKRVAGTIQQMVRLRHPTPNTPATTSAPKAEDKKDIPGGDAARKLIITPVKK